MVDEALKNRDDYKSQQMIYRSREEDITIAKAGFMPQLSGNYSFITSATSSSELFNRRIYNIGLSLNIPIFSNFRTETQLQIAKISVKNAEEDLHALKRQIKIEIKQGYLDLIAAKKQLEVSLQNVKASIENRKISSERYKLGAGKILDVLQADRDYAQSIRDKIAAEYEFYRLKDNLMNALGKLEYKSYE
jgi:outer membrane protein